MKFEELERSCGAVPYLKVVLSSFGASADWADLHVTGLHVAAIGLAKGHDLPLTAEAVTELARVGSASMRSRAERMSATPGH